jgi:hypothetical protein
MVFRKAFEGVGKMNEDRINETEIEENIIDKYEYQMKFDGKLEKKTIARLNSLAKKLKDIRINKLNGKYCHGNKYKGKLSEW